MIVVGIFVFSCKEPDLIPPNMTVTPTDSLIIVSPLKPVTFEITGFGNEDLKKFEITTTPYLFSVDTEMTGFSHNFYYKKKVEIPDLLPNLGKDSLVTVTFSLSDSYNTTKQTRTLRITAGYPQLTEDTVDLYFAFDSAMFYSALNKQKLTFVETNQDFDMVAINDDNLGFVIASPNAFFAKLKLQQLSYNYDIDNKRITKFEKFSTLESEITPQFVYRMQVGENYINNDGNFGYGVNSLNKNDFIGFETQEGIKGVAIVDSLNDSTAMMRLRIFVQVTQ